MGTTESSAVISETLCESGDLTPAMDIFSAGYSLQRCNNCLCHFFFKHRCALLELWNELHFPFDYSQLLSYRSGKYSPQKHLDKLEDPNLRKLVSSMINRVSFTI